MNKNIFTLLSSEKYFSEITRHIAATQKGDRVGLMSMGFDPSDETVKNLMQATVDAAARGVNVQLNIDAINFLVDDVSGLPTSAMLVHANARSSRQPHHKNKLAWLDTLAGQGGNWKILNWPNSRLSNPYGGRSHIKYTVINDRAYLGGCNLQHTGNADAMVCIDDRETADWIYDFILRAAKTANVCNLLEGEDTTRNVAPAATLFVDAGVPHQSKIQEEALRLIDSAGRRVVITCQFFPSHTTAKHLSAAVRRGVNVTLYFNDPRKLRHTRIFLTEALQFTEWRERWRSAPELFQNKLPLEHPYVHAKLLANEKSALIGSHNYVAQGVKFGTAETALLRHDKNFAKEIAEMAKLLTTS